MFVLKSDYGTAGDQQQAVDKLVEQIENGQERCVLLGVTGSGKTFADDFTCSNNGFGFVLIVLR